jgi:hypothetical protein
MPVMKTLIHLVWGSTVVTKAIYLVIAFYSQTPTDQATSPDPMILVVMGSIGVLSALAGALLSHQIYTNPKVYTSKLAPPVYFGHKRMPDGDLERRLFSYGLMCLGMAENAAVFGLVGSLITRDDSFLYAMIGVSLASWLLQFPRYREFEAKVLSSLHRF